MDSYGKIAVNFVKERFGDSIGPSLLNSEYKIHNINDINQLDKNSQVHFMRKFLTKRFAKFLKPQEVEAKILQLNIQYAMLEALESISTEFRQNISIKPLEIRMEAKLSTMAKAKELAIGSIIEPMHIINSMEGDLFVLVKKDKATEITRVVYYSETKGYEYGKVSERAVKKFFDLLFEKTLSSLNKLLDKDISLNLDSEKPEGNLMSNFLSKFYEAILYQDHAFFAEIPLICEGEEVKINAILAFMKG